MEINYKKFNMVSIGETDMVISDPIQCFGKWNQPTGDFTTKGAIYMILGDGDFTDTVKFLDNKGNINEASVKFFNLANSKMYQKQFEKLEEKEETTPVAEKPKITAKKKK